MTAPIRIRLAIATADGDFIATYSESGLAELDFPVAVAVATTATEARIPVEIQRWHRVTAAALKKVLSGQNPAELPPLDLSIGTEFQRQVWLALQTISLGATRSYAEVARLIGKPKAVRAVGGACGANPIPVLVPCHRVLAAQRKIGGFSSGLDWKKTLLAREGVTTA